MAEALSLPDYDRSDAVASMTWTWAAELAKGKLESFPEVPDFGGMLHREGNEALRREVRSWLEKERDRRVPASSSVPEVHDDDYCMVEDDLDSERHDEQSTASPRGLGNDSLMDSREDTSAGGTPAANSSRDGESSGHSEGKHVDSIAVSKPSDLAFGTVGDTPSTLPRSSPRGQDSSDSCTPLSTAFTPKSSSKPKGLKPIKVPPLKLPGGSGVVGRASSASRLPVENRKDVMDVDATEDKNLVASAIAQGRFAANRAVRVLLEGRPADLKGLTQDRISLLHKIIVRLFTDINYGRQIKPFRPPPRALGGDLYDHHYALCEAYSQFLRHEGPDPRWEEVETRWKMCGAMKRIINKSLDMVAKRLPPISYLLETWDEEVDNRPLFPPEEFRRPIITLKEAPPKPVATKVLLKKAPPSIVSDISASGGLGNGVSLSSHRHVTLLSGPIASPMSSFHPGPKAPRLVTENRRSEPPASHGKRGGVIGSSELEPKDRHLPKRAKDGEGASIRKGVVPLRDRPRLSWSLLLGWSAVDHVHIISETNREALDEDWIKGARHERDFEPPWEDRQPYAIIPMGCVSRWIPNR